MDNRAFVKQTEKQSLIIRDLLFHENKVWLTAVNHSDSFNQFSEVSVDLTRKQVVRLRNLLDKCLKNKD